jgi:mRNA interferase RelE/StbE
MPWPRIPAPPALDVKRLAGRSGYGLRVENWRALYEVDDAIRVIAVEDVVQRGRAYR